MKINKIISKSTKTLIKKILPSSTFKWIIENRIKLRIRWFYFIHRHDLSQVMQMLTDELSKETLLAYMRLRTRGDITPLKRVTRPEHKQYFDETVLTPGNDEVFVDMGVLDGRSSILFSEWVNRKYKAIILFEPDKISYDRSIENISHLENTVFYNEGASDFCGEVFFTNSGDGGSRISDSQTDFKITVSTLDSKISELPFAPTYIKMDIEGEECAALHGCAKTIKKYMPALSICAYHKLDDIWEIPFIIKKLNPEYQIFFRHYNISTMPSIIESGISEKDALRWELVCYAVPSKKK